MNLSLLMNPPRAADRLIRAACTIAIVLLASVEVRASEKATGSVAFKTWSGAIRYAALVRGPDEMDPARTVLRIYLSSADIGEKIKACKTLSCADKALDDGAMVDFSDSRHLGYAVKLNGSRAQYSGGTDADAFALTTSKPDHLAGKVHIDDSGAGGAKVDAQFDLTVSSTFTSVR